MATASATPGTAPSGAPRRPGAALLQRASLGLVGVLVLLLCADAGISAGTEGLGRGTLLRLAVVVGGLLVVVMLRRFEWFVLGVLVVRPALDITKSGGGGSVLASAVAGAVVLGALLWLVVQVATGRLRGVSVLSRVLVALVAVMTVSTVFAADLLQSGLQVARLAAAVAVLLVVEQLAVDRDRRRRILVACFASAAVPLLIGVHQQLTGSFIKQSSGLGRVTGTFLHPNAFGFYLVLLLTMGTALFRHLRGGLRALVGVVLVAGAVEMLLSYSRGSWISVVVALLVVGLLQVRKLLVLMPLGLGVAAVALPSIVTRLSDLTTDETVNGTPGNSFAWRLAHWQVVLRGARGHELLGLGPGASDYLGDEILPPHNDFVRMYVETGVVGTFFYLLFMLAAIAVSWQLLRMTRGTGGLDRGLAVGGIAIAVAFAVGSFGGNLISETVVLIYFFAFLGLLTASATARREAPRIPAQGAAPLQAATERARS